MTVHREYRGRVRRTAHSWVAEVYPTNPDPRLKVDAAVYREFWDNHAEAVADVNDWMAWNA